MPVRPEPFDAKRRERLLRLLERPNPWVEPKPPSRALWFAAGFGAAILLFVGLRLFFL